MHYATRNCTVLVACTAVHGLRGLHLRIRLGLKWSILQDPPHHVRWFPDPELGLPADVDEPARVRRRSRHGLHLPLHPGRRRQAQPEEGRKVFERWVFSEGMRDIKNYYIFFFIIFFFRRHYLNKISIEFFWKYLFRTHFTFQLSLLRVLISTLI